MVTTQFTQENKNPLWPEDEGNILRWLSKSQLCNIMMQLQQKGVRRRGCREKTSDCLLEEKNKMMTKIFSKTLQ